MDPSVTDPAAQRRTATALATGEQLREAIVTARRQLLQVLHARTRQVEGLSGWLGGAGDRYREEVASLLAAGRSLDAALLSLLHGLDAELAALTDNAWP